MKETYMVKAKVCGEEVWLTEAGQPLEFQEVACALEVCNDLLTGEGPLYDLGEAYAGKWSCQWAEVHSVVRLRHVS